jgi:hypothetical protein
MADAIAPPGVPQQICGYVYAHNGWNKTPALVWKGPVLQLDGIISFYNQWPWSVDDSGTYDCAGSPPPYPKVENPPPTPEPTPPTGPAPPENPPVLNVEPDEVGILIQLIQQISDQSKQPPPGGTQPPGVSSACCDAVVAEIGGVSQSLLALTNAVKAIKIPPPGEAPPPVDITCICKALADLVLAMNGLGIYANPTPPKAPDLPAVQTYTLKNATDDVQAAILLLPNLVQ